MHDCFFDSSVANHKLSYISKYISVTYALDSVSLPFRRGSRVEGNWSRVEGKTSRVEGIWSRVEGN